MRKSIVLSLAVIMVTAVVAGCAGMKGPSDEELIMQSMEKFKAGMETKNVEELMSAVSDNFSHYEWGDKAGLEGFIKDVMSQGDLDDAEVSLENAEMTIEGDAATVYPVELVAVFGSATIEFSMKKEADGVWRAVGMEVEGV